MIISILAFCLPRRPCWTIKWPWHQFTSEPIATKAAVAPWHFNQAMNLAAKISARQPRDILDHCEQMKPSHVHNDHPGAGQLGRSGRQVRLVERDSSNWVDFTQNGILACGVARGPDLIIDRIVQHTAASGSEGPTLLGARASCPLWMSPQDRDRRSTLPGARASCPLWMSRNGFPRLRTACPQVRRC